MDNYGVFRVYKSILKEYSKNFMQIGQTTVHNIE